MLEYMLDTNVCIEVLRRPNSALMQKFMRHGPVSAISTVSLHELFRGAVQARDPKQERDKVENLVAGLDLLDFDTRAAHHSSEIHATLASAGMVIGAYDMLIAGHARSLGLTVVTNNLREFTRVAGLRCEDWL